MSQDGPALEFMLTVDDLVAFTLSRNARSAPLQKMHRIFRLMFSVGLAAVVSGVGLALNTPIAAVFGVVGGAFYWFRYPRAAAAAERRHAYRVYEGQETALGLGRNRLSFDGQVLEHQSKLDTARVPLWSIENVERYPTVVYLVLPADAGIIVPIADLDPADVDAFLGELARRRGAGQP